MLCSFSVCFCILTETSHEYCRSTADLRQHHEAFVRPGSGRHQRQFFQSVCKDRSIIGYDRLFGDNKECPVLANM